ncbi:MAG: PIN domain-containing protein [Candidatus Sumerlaeota bacterium]|nr:PIN domain-containing protein [Candidatus Sumerlaeota bacterium]
MALKVLLDTNVVLDVLLAREPFVGAAAEIFDLAEQSRIEGFLCATTVTTLDYLLSQSFRAGDARQALWRLLSLFEIAPVNRSVIERALRSKMADFEDAVLAEAGRLAGVDAIITRNTKDFLSASLKTLDPTQFLAQWRA